MKNAFDRDIGRAGYLVDRATAALGRLVRNPVDPGESRLPRPVPLLAVCLRASGHRVLPSECDVDRDGVTLRLRGVVDIVRSRSSLQHDLSISAARFRPLDEAIQP